MVSRIERHARRKLTVPRLFLPKILHRGQRQQEPTEPEEVIQELTATSRQKRKAEKMLRTLQLKPVRPSAVKYQTERFEQELKSSEEQRKATEAEELHLAEVKAREALGKLETVLKKVSEQNTGRWATKEEIEAVNKRIKEIQKDVRKVRRVFRAVKTQSK